MLKKIIRISSIACLFFSSPHLLAQENTNSFLDKNASFLGELWKKTQANYPGLSAKDMRVEAAQLKEQAQSGLHLPQIKTQAQNTYSTYNGIMGAFYPQPGTFNVSGSDQLTGASMTPNSYASATLEWEVFAFGKTKNRTKSAKAYTQRTLAERETYLLELKSELSHRYLFYLYTVAQLESIQKNTNRLESLSKITSSLAKAGIKSEADSLMVSSSYQQAIGENKKLTGQKFAAEIHLEELTKEDLSLENSDLEAFYIPYILIGSMQNEVKNHPKLDEILHTQEQLEYKGKSQKQAGLPSLQFLSGYSYRGTGIGKDQIASDKWKDGFSNSATNGIIGLGITWNLTDIYTKSKAGNADLKEAESLELVHQEHQEALTAQFQAINRKIRYQFEEVRQTEKALEQATEAYEMYLARYENGLMDLSALLQIQQLLESAEMKHNQSIYEYWLLKVRKSSLTNNFDNLFSTL